MAAARAAIRVCAPGRLHLGFLDPSGSLGRRFGSLGLVIEGFETEVVISSASEDAVFADTPAARGEVDRVAACLERLRERTAAAIRSLCGCAAHCPRMPGSAPAPSSRWRWAAPSRSGTA